MRSINQLTAAASRLGRFLLALGVGAVAVFLLVGCVRHGWEPLTKLSSDQDWERRVASERQARSVSSTAPAVVAPAVTWFPDLAKAQVDQADDHREKAKVLQQQLSDVERSIDALKSDRESLRKQLASERFAVFVERVVAWIVISGAVAVAAAIAGFVFEGVSRYLWRLSIGSAVVCAILGVVAIYAEAWWILVPAGLVIVVVAVFLLRVSIKHGLGFSDLVNGIQLLKTQVGDVYKEPLRAVQRLGTTDLVDSVRSNRQN